MPAGFILSLVLHTALLAWALLSIHRTEQLPVPETVAISVAVVTPSEVTRMKQGDQNTKNLESKAADKPAEEQETQKEAAKPKAAVAPSPPPPPAPEPEPVKPPPPPEPVKAAEPPPPEPKPDPIADKLAALPPEPPGPTPEELAAEAERKAKEEAAKKAQAEAQRKAKEEAARKAKELAARKAAEAKAKAAAKAKADAEKNKFDLDQIAKSIEKADDGPQKALLDKSNKQAGAKPTGDSKTATNVGPSAGTADGRDTVLSAREADMLTSLINSQLRACWRLPAGGGGAQTPIVTLSWRLKQDGSLDGEPQVIAPQNLPAFGVAAEAAVRAVKTCAPFRLPPDKYTNWRDIKSWAFDPTKML